MECQLYSSNIYILEDVQYDYVYLVDVGEKNIPIPNNKKVKGIFITHTHIDHIQGVNDLIARYPDCVIYTNKEGYKGLYDDKINLTFYHERPLAFKGGNIVCIKDGNHIPIFDGIEMMVIETPGHHPSCVSYRVEKSLFTGDSFIPGVKVVTKLKGGNKEQAMDSIKRLCSFMDKDTIICPGHGKMACVQS